MGRTMVENEQMTTEVQYQSRETGRLVRANLELQAQVRAQKQELETVTSEIAAKEKAIPEKELATLEAEWEKTRLASLPAASRRIV